MSCNDFSYRPVAGLVSSARLYRPVYVGETLLLESFIDSLDEAAVQYHSFAYVGDEVVFSIDGALGPLLPMNDFIDGSLVRRQFNEINRPGDYYSVNSTSEESIVDHCSAITPPMLFDKIITCEPGLSLCAEKRVTRAAAYFADHFPNKPVLPMTVLLECKLNLAREFVARASFSQPYRIHEMRKIKMNVFVHPGDILITHVKVKSHDDNELVLSFRSEVDGKRVCVLDIVMKPEGNP